MDDDDDWKANFDEHGKPWPRAAEGEPRCGAKMDRNSGCECALVPGHGGLHECGGDSRGWSGSCPA